MKRVLALALVLLASPGGAGEFVPFVRGSWAELRQAHQGRSTIVHFWGVTCGPCLVELPEWSRFATSAPGVDVVFVAADPVPEPPGDLAAMLRKAGLADAENWFFADRFIERLQYEIDPSWHGELPLTITIARNGTQTAALGTANFADLRAWTEAQTR